MTRRTLLASLAAASTRRYRVALIGDTGHGNFGHDWDIAWNNIPGAEVAGVADPDPTGRAKAQQRSRARNAYADYRQMIAAEKPHIVGICPRWLDQRVPMVKAAVEAGAHILLEKPIAATLEEADRIVEIAERGRVKVQVGHTARIFAVTAAVRDMMRRGELGQLMEIRARGKEDRRAGGEDLMVLGTHCFDLMRYFAGDPQWVFATIEEKGRPARSDQARQATEPVGPVLGDDIAAMFRFANGLPAYFGSKASDMPRNDRFGVTLYGSKALVYLPLTDVPSGAPYLLRNPSWVGAKWERIDYPSGQAPPERGAVNAMMAADLIDAIEKDRDPICSARDARWTIEMLTGIYQSHFAGTPARFPLNVRRVPFG